MTMQNNTLIAPGQNSADFWRSRVSGPGAELRGQKARAISQLGTEAARRFQSQLSKAGTELDRPEDQAASTFLFLRSFLGAEAADGVMETAEQLLADIGVKASQNKVASPVTKFRDELKEAIFQSPRGVAAARELLQSESAEVEDLAKVTAPILNELLAKLAKETPIHKLTSYDEQAGELSLAENFYQTIELLINEGKADAETWSQDWYGIFADDDAGQHARFFMAMDYDIDKFDELVELLGLQSP